MDGEGEALGELLDGDGVLDPVALGLAESLGDALVLALPEGLAAAERLVVEVPALADFAAACINVVLAAVSSVAPTVWVRAALVVMSEVFFSE